MKSLLAWAAEKLDSKAGRIIVATLIFGIGMGSGYFLCTRAGEAGSSFSLLFVKNTPYEFVRPLLGIAIPKSYDQGKWDPLRAEVLQTAAALPESALVRYAYYFKDLTTGAWTGVNEKDQYDPASMLKLVVAIAVYKQSETTPGFLSRELTYTQDLANINAAFPFAPPVALKVGESYTVPFLLKEMLSDSDNAAKDLLLSSIDQATIDRTYTDLSIPKPDDLDSNGYTISPVDYTRFLRVLYYGTYDISWSNSNRLLQLLNGATFTNGLVAGIPNTVPVAHKYGEHVIGANGVEQGVELSDCGIVYHPKSPYTICVMTEGKNPLVLANFIARLSRVTYDEVQANSASE
ncbi:MAG: serine hydrolase [Patescibacteria group bacterium]|nr:serine hydrolase [Patescibacteria group bacterium]